MTSLSSHCWLRLPRTLNGVDAKRKSLSTILAENLRRLKRKPGLESQPKMGARSRVGQRTVGRSLNEETSPRLSTLERLADGCNVDPWELLMPEEEARVYEQFKAFRKIVGSDPPK
jgi:transcriptional regulator with XRE-family HTH domain